MVKVLVIALGQQVQLSLELQCSLHHQWQNPLQMLPVFAAILLGLYREIPSVKILEKLLQIPHLYLLYRTILRCHWQPLRVSKHQMVPHPSLVELPVRVRCGMLFLSWHIEYHLVH